MEGYRKRATKSLHTLKINPTSQYTEPQSTQFSPANATIISRISSPLFGATTRVAVGRGKKRPLIVKKLTQSVPGSAGRTTPLLPTDRKSKRYQKSESEEELLNVVKATEAVLPMPTPEPAIVTDFSVSRTVFSPDKQRIALLESKLQQLSSRYKKLEGSYRVLLVRESSRETAFSPDSDPTRDSVQMLMTPRHEPMTEVLHMLRDLKGKVERVEVLTSALWARLSHLSE